MKSRITVLARSHNPRVLIERESDVGFEGQTGAFENDLGDKFVAHSGSLKQGMAQCNQHYAIPQTKISLRAI